MPPVTTVPSDETDDTDANVATAFTIINDDTLKPLEPYNATIKPLLTKDQQINRTKPNVIVYPTRRISNQNGALAANFEEQKQRVISKANGFIYNTQPKNALNLKKDFTYSQGNLNNNIISNVRNKRGCISEENISNLEFTKSLDAKLRKLQHQEEIRSRNSSNSRLNVKEDNRKPFVTVVKKGRFLNPPAQVASKLGLEPEPEDNERTERVYIAKRMYAYASKPKVLRGGAGDKSGGSAANAPNGISGRISSRTNRILPSNGELAITSDAHRARCEAAATAAASIASGVAGMMRFKRDTNGSWNLQNEVQPQYSNIMFDKRVVRGNTYAQQPMPTGDGESQAAREAEARRRALARKKAQAKQVRGLRLRLGSPPPVAGRKHEPIQTEKFLEELFENPSTADVVTQTDLFLDRPASPYYVPAKVGLDAETQIWPGDLFDFDMEVQPILEVLVGKTVEQSLVEVLEEEEIAALRAQQRRFEEIRNAEIAEIQRLEELERRYRQEKDRRLVEHQEGARIQKETEERVAAAVLMQGYIGNLLPSVLDGLKEDGFLIENMKNEAEENFMPWLMKETAQELEIMVTSRDVLSDIVKEILETRNEIYRAMGEAEAEKNENEGSTDDDDDVESSREVAFELESEEKEEVEIEGNKRATKG